MVLALDPPWSPSRFSGAPDSHAAGETLDPSFRGALEEQRVAFVRIPVSIVVSGFLFAYVGVWQATVWLSTVLTIEAVLAFIRLRTGAAEDPRAKSAVVTGIFLLALCWVVHALLLWRQTAEVARIATLMDLFTISLYGAIAGRKDWRILLALMAPPLATLLIILLHLLWTQATPVVAVIASLATLGACGTIAAIAFAMYVSDQQLSRAYAATQRQRDTLEMRVAARTADLARASEVAQAANIAKSQFLATMSHELRTPLNAIIGYSEILQDEIRDGVMPTTRDVERIESAGRHLLSMINDILDLSKIDAGKMEVNASPTDIRALMERVTETVNHLATAGANTVSVCVGDDVGQVMTDGRKLFQCIVNLAANACKFTRDGRVDIDARLENGSLVVSVRDTGCGMDPDKIASLFHPFVQLDSGLTRQHEGSGLGLAISRRLARLLGGDIHIVSAPGSGTTAWITLPLEAQT